MARYQIVRLVLILGLIALLIPVALVQAQGGSGTVVIRDGGSLSDTATITMTGVLRPEEGTAYEGWLVSDDGTRKVSAGILAVSDDGNISHAFALTDASGENPTGENLLAGFNVFMVTVEPIPDSDPAPSATIAYSHTIPVGGMLHIRHLSGTPTGIVVGLREQTELAWNHAKLAQESARSGDLASVQRHACHIVNIVGGAGGSDFDASCSNPGDGIGVLSYASDAAVHASLARTAAPDDATIVENGAGVIDASNASADFAGRALAQVLLAKNTADLLTATLYVNNAESQLSDNQARQEGALYSARQAYESAQAMGTYTISELPSVGEPMMPQMAKGAIIGGFVLLMVVVALYLRPWARLGNM